MTAWGCFEPGFEKYGSLRAKVVNTQACCYVPMYYTGGTRQTGHRQRSSDTGKSLRSAINDSLAAACLQKSRPGAAVVCFVSEGRNVTMHSGYSPFVDFLFSFFTLFLPRKCFTVHTPGSMKNPEIKFGRPQSCRPCSD